MDRVEILKLALGVTKDLHEALDLAKQMAEFVANRRVPKRVPRDPNEPKRRVGRPRKIVEPVEPIEVVEPAAPVEQAAPEVKQPHRRINKYQFKIRRAGLIAPGVLGYRPERAEGRRSTPRAALKWSDQEKLQAAEMLDAGLTFDQVAQQLQRTFSGIEKAWKDGLFPCRIQYTAPKAQ